MYIGQNGSVLYGNKSPVLICAVNSVVVSVSIVLGTTLSLFSLAFYLMPIQQVLGQGTLFSSMTY